MNVNIERLKKDSGVAGLIRLINQYALTHAVSLATGNKDDENKSWNMMEQTIALMAEHIKMKINKDS